VARAADTVITREIWAARDGVKLHAVEWSPRGERAGLPILAVGGALSTAWNAQELGVAAASGVLGVPRSLISPDRRGVGLSSAPRTGYMPSDFAKDSRAIVAAAGVGDVVVYGHSLGVPIAIAYALEHRDTVRGLALGDYPARWPRLTGDWLDRALAAFDGTWSREGVAQMHRESVETSYWSDLADLQAPVLAITGTNADVRLKPDDAERYRRACGDASLVVINGADHSLTVDGDHAPFFAVLRGFLAGIDRATSTH